MAGTECSKGCKKLWTSYQDSNKPGCRLPKVGHSSDRVVPTLSTLCNSANIQAQVNTCLQELEQANQMNTAGTGDSSVVVPDLSKKVTVGSKRGRDKKVSVPWHQDLAFVRTLRKRPQYEDLPQT